MNRYALFFLTVISLHASNALLNAQNEELKSKIEKIFEGKDEETKFSYLHDKFTEIFNDRVLEEDLNLKERKRASAVRHTCIDDLLKHFSPNSINESAWEIAKQGVKECMAQIAQVRTECELEKISISTKLQQMEELLCKAHQLGACLEFKDSRDVLMQVMAIEADNKYYCGNGKSSYLVREDFEEHLSEMIDRLSSELSEIINNAQNKKEK